MKKLITLFLFTTIGFGFFQFVIFGDFTRAFTSGLLFGLIMTIILGSFHFISMKSNGDKTGAASVKQEKDLEMHISYDRTFKLCKNSLQSIKGMKITCEDYQKGNIQAKTGINMKTWGDKISIHIQKIDEETSSVHIQSKPIVPSTILDYGKNLNNIKVISNYLEQESH